MNFVARQNFAKRKSRSLRGFLPRPLLRAGESIAPPPQPQKNSDGAHHSFFSKKVRANDTITSQNENVSICDLTGNRTPI